MPEPDGKLRRAAKQEDLHLHASLRFRSSSSESGSPAELGLMGLKGLCGEALSQVCGPLPLLTNMYKIVQNCTNLRWDPGVQGDSTSCATSSVDEACAA